MFSPPQKRLTDRKKHKTRLLGGYFSWKERARIPRLREEKASFFAAHGLRTW